MLRATQTLAGIALALACCEAARAETPTPAVEYLTIDANEGSASGGHVALRISDRVYHFQRDASGALGLRRESWAGFAFQYRVIENRSLSATRLAISAGQTEGLRRRLDREWMLEEGETRRLRALRRDIALLEVLASPPGERELEMRGAGFFARGRQASTPPERAGADALRLLDARIRAEHGVDFPGAHERRAQELLRVLDPERSEIRGDTRSPLAALGVYAFSSRYDDLFAAGLALDLLAEAPPLRRSALTTPPKQIAALSPAERQALETRRAGLETELVRLIASSRPDWGGAFLLGMARLAALAESLASGQLRVLDAFPADSGVLDPATLASARERLIRRRTWRSDRLVAARTIWSVNPSERNHARLEAAVARLAELDGALHGGLALRLPSRPLAARGEARVHRLPRPAFASLDAAGPLGRARRRLLEAVDVRATRSRYDLVKRNCVTELQARIARALGASQRPAEATLFSFVPFLSEAALRESWLEGGRRTLLSLRRETLERSSWLVALRESNTLTSTLYTPHPADSSFLFFTDDAPALRPLLGALNLATGVASAVGGLVKLPFDAGALLMRGLRGSAASVPELFFFNIRKGTFPFALPADATRSEHARGEEREAS